MRSYTVEAECHILNRRYVKQILTHEEILDFVKCDYSNYKWSTVFPLIRAEPQISTAL